MTLKPKWWNSNITLYNKHIDSVTGEISWYRHNLSDVFLKRTNTNTQVGDVKLLTDTNIIRILRQNDFLSPFEWQKLPNDQKGNYFTLQTGDIIILGNVSDEINEYIKGERSTDLISKYENTLGSISIQSVNINDWGKLAHYLVMGN